MAGLAVGVGVEDQVAGGGDLGFTAALDVGGAEADVAADQGDGGAVDPAGLGGGAALGGEVGLAEVVAVAALAVLSAVDDEVAAGAEGDVFALQLDAGHFDAGDGVGGAALGCGGEDVGVSI